MDLSGQVAIVTGGGRGIGRQIALSLADAGARVAVVSRSRAELAETARLAGRSRVLVTPGDMTDHQAMERIVAEVGDHFGPVSLLVNNAAVFTPGEPPLWSADLDEWWRTFEVNVRGPLVCTRAVLPTMIAEGRGRVITVGSDSGVLPGPLSSYSFSKNALVRFTESLTASLTAADHPIRVFTMAPGTVRTTLTESFAVKYPDIDWTPVELSGRLAVNLASGHYDALHGRYLTVSDDLDTLLSEVDDVRRRELYVQRMRGL
nr:SDR family oxidoreductase [Kibdelosporangium sp. MJ126-NF4]CEL20579.1 3-oxoacyl-[acyl-carrier protein] reductase [Kibdelosporangium sp. MJ126-NF4]CTQ89490.1 3-oxoacyl-[acyl-carrier protein] reductase (EC 1.1.1.100) [Kibdelosporangium sp. MJ126-NF4]